MGDARLFPSMEESGLGFVANHFDVVSVRTDDERCIVVRLSLSYLADQCLTLIALTQRSRIGATLSYARCRSLPIVV